MNSQKIGLALKTTNWCNLNCAHCCECSNQHISPNIMPLNTVEKHIHDFKEMLLPTHDYVVFTGGETMAPYYHGDANYIPSCLDIVASRKMAPFVKTNGTWGIDEKLREQILRNFGDAAHRHNTLMSMDLSVDAFHKNTVAVHNILNDVIRSQYLSSAIRISLCSLNHTQSRVEFSKLIESLRSAGIEIHMSNNGSFVAGVPDVRSVSVHYDVWTNIGNVGRASENGLGQFVPDGKPDSVMGHCLQIDNNDTATLNNKYHTAINGRPLPTVARELLLRSR